MPHERMPHNPAMSISPAEKSRLPSLWFDEITLDTGSDYVVKGLLSDGGLSMLYGPSGCGKSFLATDMALAVARGVPWFGRRVRGGGVIYVAAEGQQGFKKRLAAYRQANLCEGETQIPFRLVHVPIRLLEGQDKAELIKLVEEGCPDNLPVRMVVIDTLSRTMAGGDENDSLDMGRYLNALTAIQTATGAHVCVIHHSGKNVANGARGHSSLLAAVDTAIEVSKDGGRKAAIVKQKDGRDGDTIDFDLETHEIGIDADGEAITSCTVIPSEGHAPQSVKLSRTTRRARDLLAEAINTAGQIPPPSPHIPSTATAVTTDVWREYCYKGGLTASNETDTKRKTFNRARQDLIAAGIVGTWDNWAWSSEPGHGTGTRDNP